MEWFKKSKKGIGSQEKKEIPENLWVKCEVCSEIIYRKELEKTLWVCPKCDAHFRVNSTIYKEVLLDATSFTEIDSMMSSVDTLKFVDKKKYVDRIVENEKKSGLKDAIITGHARMFGRRVAIGIMDFRYLGGSMGSVVGEKIKRVADYALKENLPLILISASGGARMQEGALSLMQMAKTSAAVGRLHKAGLPYISLLTHPTTGGVTASFAMLGDLNIAEPGALVGFAGPRVIRETIRQELPDGFQRAEFVKEHGFIDFICDRRNLKKKITLVLDLLMGKEPGENKKSDLFIDEKGNIQKETVTVKK